MSKLCPNIPNSHSRTLIDVPKIIPAKTSLLERSERGCGGNT